MRSYYAEERYGDEYDALDAEERAVVDERVQQDLESGAASDEIRYSEAERYAHEQVRQTYVERYHEGDAERGVPAGMVESEEEAEEFADFALWTAWIAHTDRPGSDHTYTNEWPYQPAAGNEPTAGTMTWSVISVVLLVAGAGVGVWLYKSIDLPEPETNGIEVPQPADVDVFPSQIAASKFVLVAAGLFLGQVLLGGLLAHYYVERDAFFGLGELLGVDFLSLIPFAVAKTWHIDLGIRQRPSGTRRAIPRPPTGTVRRRRCAGAGSSVRSPVRPRCRTARRRNRSARPPGSPRRPRGGASRRRALDRFRPGNGVLAF